LRVWDYHVILPHHPQVGWEETSDGQVHLWNTESWLFTPSLEPVMLMHLKDESQEPFFVLVQW